MSQPDDRSIEFEVANVGPLTYNRYFGEEAPPPGSGQEGDVFVQVFKGKTGEQAARLYGRVGIDWVLMFDKNKPIQHPLSPEYRLWPAGNDPGWRLAATIRPNLTSGQIITNLITFGQTRRKRARLDTDGPPPKRRKWSEFVASAASSSTTTLPPPSLLPAAPSISAPPMGPSPPSPPALSTPYAPPASLSAPPVTPTASGTAAVPKLDLRVQLTALKSSKKKAGQNPLSSPSASRSKPSPFGSISAPGPQLQPQASPKRPTSGAAPSSEKQPANFVASPTKERPATGPSAPASRPKPPVSRRLPPSPFDNADSASSTAASPKTRDATSIPSVSLQASKKPTGSNPVTRPQTPSGPLSASSSVRPKPPLSRRPPSAAGAATPGSSGSPDGTGKPVSKVVTTIGDSTSAPPSTSLTHDKSKTTKPSPSTNQMKLDDMVQATGSSSKTKAKATAMDTASMPESSKGKAKAKTTSVGSAIAKDKDKGKSAVLPFVASKPSAAAKEKGKMKEQPPKPSEEDTEMLDVNPDISTRTETRKTNVPIPVDADIIDMTGDDEDDGDAMVVDAPVPVESVEDWKLEYPELEFPVSPLRAHHPTEMSPAPVPEDHPSPPVTEAPTIDDLTEAQSVSFLRIDDELERASYERLFFHSGTVHVCAICANVPSRETYVLVSQEEDVVEWWKELLLHLLKAHMDFANVHETFSRADFEEYVAKY